MSGAVSTIDAPPTVADRGHPSAPCIEVTDSRDEQVGKAGPADVTENSGLDVGPHPHIGLQTVTWLIDGQVLHRDRLGSEQVNRPCQLNLMTSGGAVSHAEEATGHYRGTLEGIQLWARFPREPGTARRPLSSTPSSRRPSSTARSPPSSSTVRSDGRGARGS